MLFKPERSVINGELTTAWRHLQFRPHGASLLSSGAAFWLFAARILVLTMACVEAVAWGYLGFLFGDDWERWLYAGLVGFVILLVVWIIDASLLTFDRAADEHAARIYGETTQSRGRNVRLSAAIATRVLLVVASLTITAPYLAQVIFYKEIQGIIEAQAVSVLEGTRTELLEIYERQLSALGEEVKEKQAQLEQEIGGAGLSRRYGMGPVAESMQAGIEALNLEAGNITQERDRKLEDFDLLAEDWKAQQEVIASRYGVVLPRQTILSSRAALQELGSRPDFQQTQLAIKAFLAFIFVGLLLLKLFEPRSVRFYLSDVMQGEYSRYLAGAFDSLLPPVERSSRGSDAMTPERLFEFLVSEWRTYRASEAEESGLKAKKAAALEDVRFLQGLMERLEPLVERARNQVGEDQVRFEDAHRRYRQLMSAIEIVQGHVAAFQTEAEGLNRFDARGRAEYGTAVRENLWKAENKLRELKHSEELEREKFERTKATLQRAEEKLASRNSELEEIEGKIRHAHLQSLHPSIGDPSEAN